MAPPFDDFHHLARDGGSRFAAIMAKCQKVVVFGVPVPDTRLHRQFDRLNIKRLGAGGTADAPAVFLAFPLQATQSRLQRNRRVTLFLAMTEGDAAGSFRCRPLAAQAGFQRMRRITPLRG